MPKLVENETKLLATALNGIAISSVTVGLLTPLAAVFYNLGGFGELVLVRTLVVGVSLWLFAAIALPVGARYVLGGLRE
jgi:hypothetical protein